MSDTEGVSHPILEELTLRLDEARRTGRRDRPFITLAYAQSLDGSIAGQGHRPLTLSGPSSMVLTHELRAAHEAILVGLGTVQADDPQLNVRLTEGEDPQPVVVDSQLRISPSCQLMRQGRKLWLATTEAASRSREEALQAQGVDVLRVSALGNGWVDLEALVHRLFERGVADVLIEGGARILNGFLRARLADYVVLTVAPQFVGGVPALCESELSPPFPRLLSWRSERVGEDLVIAGELSWSSE